MLTLTLFGIVFALMLQDAFRERGLSVYFQFKSDFGIFNLRRFSARTKVGLTEL